jgi:hypothetical protein
MDLETALKWKFYLETWPKTNEKKYGVKIELMLAKKNHTSPAGSESQKIMDKVELARKQLEEEVKNIEDIRYLNEFEFEDFGMEVMEMFNKYQNVYCLNTDGVKPFFGALSPVNPSVFVDAYNARNGSVHPENGAMWFSWQRITREDLLKDKVIKTLLRSCGDFIIKLTSEMAPIIDEQFLNNKSILMRYQPKEGVLRHDDSNYVFEMIESETEDTINVGDYAVIDDYGGYKKFGRITSIAKGWYKIDVEVRNSKLERHVVETKSFRKEQLTKVKLYQKPTKSAKFLA